MSDDEPPTIPDADSDARNEDTTGGKLISADVFLARLAERRQAERPPTTNELPTLESLLNALGSLGLDPSRGVTQPDTITPSPENESSLPGVDELGVMQSLLEHLQATRASASASDDDGPDWAEIDQQAALLHLSERLNPDELHGATESPPLPPEHESALDAGVASGTQRALNEIHNPQTKTKRRSAKQRVAEKPTRYDAKRHNDPSAPGPE